MATCVNVARPVEIIDFGHSPIFPDADTFPCILIVERRQKPLTPGDQPDDRETFGSVPNSTRTLE